MANYVIVLLVVTLGLLAFEFYLRLRPDSKIAKAIMEKGLVAGLIDFVSKAITRKQTN